MRRGRGDLRSIGMSLVALTCAASLSACASISEKMSEKMATAPGIGEPAAAPQRQATPAMFPAVHDMPRARAMDLLERLRPAEDGKQI